MDDAGRFVGSATFGSAGRLGFLYDPALADPFTFLLVDGRPTSARGLNNHGDVVGFFRDVSGFLVGFRGLPVAGQAVERIACPEIAGLVEVTPESINDDGVVSGIWSDASGTFHGFIAYPSPALPQAVANGAFVFTVPVSAGVPVFLDPPAAVGYQYAIGPGDPRFTSVRLPIGIGDDLYTVLAEGRAFPLAAGQRLDFDRNGFAAGVAAFEVLGIEPGANLDPASPTAFVTEVRFGADGRFTGTMRPMTVADELADLVDAATGVGPGTSLAAKARSAGAAFARGEVPVACATLGALLSEVGAQTGKKLAAPLAGAIAAEAAAIASALACP
jgi:hypothetical protein